ncbi:hypothetical protein BGW39_007635 [Mortierella sp. 14UC]|nr:hypothetical protein BGW39_007635 [Mortierella sp. 14UC]
MRTIALFAALLAIGASTVAAAPPSNSFPKPAQPTASVDTHPNITLSGDEHTASTKAEIEEEKFLRARLPKYDPKAAAEFAEYYQSLVYGNNQTARNNALRRPQAGVRAAAAYSGLPTSFCVGIAWNPTRTQIFKNSKKCDVRGWTTLWLFTALTDFDAYMGNSVSCIGKAENPSRSMIFPGTAYCNVSGWDKDFHLSETGRPIGTPGQQNDHESTEVWQKSDPHRMMLYPYYDGTKHGWQWKYSLRYITRWRLPTSKELEDFKSKVPPHGELRKRNWDHQDIETKAELHAVESLISQWGYNEINFSDKKVHLASSFSQVQQSAGIGQFTHLMNDLTNIEINSHWYSTVTTVFINVNGRILASATLRKNVNYGYDTIQQALRLSAGDGNTRALEAHESHQRIFGSVPPSGDVEIISSNAGPWSMYGDLN